MANRMAQDTALQLPYPIQEPPHQIQQSAPSSYETQPLFGPLHGSVPNEVQLNPMHEIKVDSNARTSHNLSQPAPYTGLEPHAIPMPLPPNSGVMDAKYDQKGAGSLSFSDHGGKDPESGLHKPGTFSDKAIRRAFVRKVYVILMIQLAITAGFVAFFIYELHVKRFIQTTPAAYYAAYGVFLVVYLTLVCAEGLRRSYPTNLILLFVFTLVMSYLVGTISSFYDTDTVLMAGGICAVCCLLISLFSCHTKFDFTTCGGFLFMGLCVLILFGILSIFTHDRIINTVYACVGALVFMVFLAFDTQTIMGGRKVELSPEEYIFAALQLYMDVVQLFLMLLKLMGIRR